MSNDAERTYSGSVEVDLVRETADEAVWRMLRALEVCKDDTISDGLSGGSFGLAYHENSNDDHEP